MRCSALPLIALLAVAVPAAAQERRFGARGGVALSTQSTSDGGPSLDSRTGLVAGAFYTLPLGWLDVQVEGLYAQRGARVKVLGIESTLALDYVDVPVLARVRFGSGHRRYYAVAGPSTAFRVRAKTRTAFSGSTEEVDVADAVESIDFGLAAGGGVEIGRLVVDGRYTYGFKDVDKDASSTAKNRTIAVTAGFRF